MSTRKPMRLELFAIAALSALMVWGIAVGSPARAAAEKAAAPADKVPDSLTKAGDAAKTLYDAAKAKDWTKAEKQFAILKEAASKVNADMGKKAKAEKARIDRLAKAVTALEKAVPAKEALVTMEEANLATVTVARLADVFHPKVPFEATKLDYEGRRLEMYSEPADLKKLQSAAKAIDGAWATFKPQVVAKGGDAQAAEFDKLVAQLKKAQTAKEYGAVAKPILDAVDTLEKVFTK